MTGKRFTIDKEYDTDGNWEYCYVDNDTGRTFNFADDFCDTDFIELVNAIISSLTDENEQLKQRNNRQAKQLDNLYTLIEKQDWKTLKGIIQEFQECEEQLQREWKCYE